MQATLDALAGGLENADVHQDAVFRGVVRGSWYGRDLRLRLRRIAYTNSWAHQLHIVVIDSGEGATEVHGYVGVPAWVRAFTAFWLATVAAFAIFVGATALTSHPGPPVAVVLIPVFMFVLGLGIAVGAARVGRKDGEFLVNWVRARLWSQP